MPRSYLSIGAARRLALAAQGFADPAPSGRVDVRHFRRVLGRLGLLQLDSVQAVCRSHFLPVYSRLGPYDRAALDDWLWRSGEMFEAWSHEASVVPVALEPLLRWSRQRAAEGGTWAGLHAMATAQAPYVAEVLEEVGRHGPLLAGDLSDPRPRQGTWWSGRSDGRRALDWLFRIGEVGITRTRNFEKEFRSLVHLVPEEVRSLPTPGEHEAQRDLLERAARSHGVGTATDLADYFRLKVPEVRPRLAELVDAGRLLEVSVEGWREPGFRHPEAVLPRRVDARALLSPFDPVVWFRPRAERLFGFRYRIEIYVPAGKREYGYYVLPFLLGDTMVGRVDVKADRAGGRLLARGVFAEEGVDREWVAAGLRVELERLSRFLGLDDVVVGRRGNLAAALRAAGA
ncbi:MAG: YcaQ family DNA glycosylase [Actinobacteria bacterium]|nr:YcaQ family DNA glycosylase [Actinomycetota bacterium]